jgi:hypothetical protein
LILIQNTPGLEIFQPQGCFYLDLTLNKPMILETAQKAKGSPMASAITGKRSVVRVPMFAVKVATASVGKVIKLNMGMIFVLI